MLQVSKFPFEIILTVTSFNMGMIFHFYSSSSTAQVVQVWENVLSDFKPMWLLHFKIVASLKSIYSLQYCYTIPTTRLTGCLSQASPWAPGPFRSQIYCCVSGFVSTRECLILIFTFHKLVWSLGVCHWGFWLNSLSMTHYNPIQVAENCKVSSVLIVELYSIV